MGRSMGSWAARESPRLICALKPQILLGRRLYSPASPTYMGRTKTPRAHQCSTTPFFPSGAACGKPRENTPPKISSNGRGFILRSAPLAKSLLCQFRGGVEVDLIRPLSEDFESGLNDGPTKFEGTT